MRSFSYWILEDEPPALRRLQRVIGEVAPGSTAEFSADSIAPARVALKDLPHPDVIFSDMHLADGLSLDLWESVACHCPIIFTTAYDQYSIRAFRTNGIDYLLKPVSAEELKRALEKLERLRTAPTPDWKELAGLLRPPTPAYRQRMLVRHRDDWVPVDTNDLRQVYSADGLTFALDAGGKRYLVDDSLERLAEELDPRRWFRINRGQLVHIDGVKKVSGYFNHRLILELDTRGEGDNIVSRQRVKECREWLGK